MPRRNDSRVTFKEIAKIEGDRSKTRSERRNSLEGCVRRLMNEMVRRRPSDKEIGVRYAYLLIEIARAAWRVGGEARTA